MMKYLLILPILMVIVSCASTKQVKFDNTRIQDKTYNFSMTKNSQGTQIEMGGTYLGESEIPNNVEVFKESLSILSKNLNVDLKYATYSKENPSTNLITADFKKATWFFGASRATMTAVIEYTLPNGEKMEVEGIYRAFGIGTKKQFLKNAFINANSKF